MVRAERAVLQIKSRQLRRSWLLKKDVRQGLKATMVNDPSNASSPENQVKTVGPLAATEKNRDFRWDTPERFNFGDVIDAFAADPKRVAILWEDQDGNRARLTFADLRDQSNRIANTLAGLGIRRGDS